MQIEFENKYARLSLISITWMMFLTSIHHIFRLGYGLLIPTIILTALPYLLMRWYTKLQKHNGIKKLFVVQRVDVPLVRVHRWLHGSCT